MNEIICQKCGLRLECSNNDELSNIQCTECVMELSIAKILEYSKTFKEQERSN